MGGPAEIGSTLSVKLSHYCGTGAAVFEHQNLVSSAGLVPIMELAEQAGSSALLDELVVFRCERSGPMPLAGPAAPADRR